MFPTAPLNPEEMLRFMRRNALLSLFVGAAILAGLTGSFYFSNGWSVGSTVLLALALVLVATGGYVLTPYHTRRYVTKYAATYERLRSGPTPELMRASLRVAMKALVALLAALVVEVPIAAYFWPDEELQSWLVAMMGVTVLFTSLMVAILVRDRRWW